MQSQYSKTLRFDLPRVPILGSILFMLLIKDLPWHSMIFLGNNYSVNTGLIASSILFLGVAGLTFAQLVSFCFFNPLYRISDKFRGSNDRRINSSYDWFRSFSEQAKPRLRRPMRAVGHSIDDRETLSTMGKRRIHATLHALEMELRGKMPAIGTQIEYYYSIYVICFVAGLFTVAITIISWRYDVYNMVSWNSFLNAIIFTMFTYTAIMARVMKEQLRLSLINTHRTEALELLCKWLHVEIDDIRQSKVLIEF